MSKKKEKRCDEKWGESEKDPERDGCDGLSGPGGGRQRVMSLREGAEVGEDLWIHDGHSIQMLQGKTEHSRKMLLNSILQMHKLRLNYDSAAHRWHMRVWSGITQP